jgi:hypothetical protein
MRAAHLGPKKAQQAHAAQALASLVESGCRKCAGNDNSLAEGMLCFKL